MFVINRKTTLIYRYFQQKPLEECMGCKLKIKSDV